MRQTHTQFFLTFSLTEHPHDRFHIQLPWTTPSFTFTEMDAYFLGVVGKVVHPNTRKLKRTENIPEPVSTNWFRSRLCEQARFEAKAAA